MPLVTDPVILLRQSVCAHAFIKAPNCPKRCAHCGVDEKEWEQRQEDAHSAMQQVFNPSNWTMPFTFYSAASSSAPSGSPKSSESRGGMATLLGSHITPLPRTNPVPPCGGAISRGFAPHSCDPTPKTGRPHPLYHPD